MASEFQAIGQWATPLLTAALLAFPLAVSPMATTPAHAAEKASKPRSKVEEVPGDYIQLETLWVPVVNRAGNNGYMGLVVRLWPGDTTRYEGCIAAPHAADALMVDFNKSPLQPDIYYDDTKLLQRVTSVVNQKVADKTYKKIEVIRDFVSPDDQSGMLTLTCR